MKKQEKIISTVCCAIFALIGVFVLVKGIRGDDIGLIVGGGITAVFGLVITAIDLSLNISISRANKKLNKEIESVKNKINKTTFDYFLIDVINERAEELLTKHIITNNENNPSDLYFAYEKSNKADFGYSYRDFEVEFTIEEKGIEIVIFLPEEYDNAETTSELETEKYVECNFNEMSNEEVYIYLADKISECNELIEKFLLNKEKNSF